MSFDSKRARRERQVNWRLGQPTKRSLSRCALSLSWLITRRTYAPRLGRRLFSRASLSLRAASIMRHAHRLYTRSYTKETLCRRRLRLYCTLYPARACARLTSGAR